MDLNLTGKTALVTGGGRDVGREIALQLAAEGAYVAVNYNRSADEAAAVVRDIEAAGGSAKAYGADIADYAAVTAMVDSVVADFGRIDVLVNNAGYVKVQKFLESGPEDWKPQIDTCLYGAIHCCRAAAPHMVKQNSGSHHQPDRRQFPHWRGQYLHGRCRPRAGTMALGKSLAKELGRNNITVNTVSLGLVQTSHSDAEFLAKNYGQNRPQLPAPPHWQARRRGTDDSVPGIRRSARG